MSMALAAAETAFELSDERHAKEPPEARGIQRDEVRLLVVGSDGIHHARFGDVVDFLKPGDLVVVNVSATLAAAVDGVRLDGSPGLVHFSAPVDDTTWVVELRGENGPLRDAGVGYFIYLPGGGRVEITDSYPQPAMASSRLWQAQIDVAGQVENWLERYGRPISYGYVPDRWPLSDYQTIFARIPGSAEMPSAARPFTNALVTDLVVRGIHVAPILLHTGVSSLEGGEPPQEERYEVSESTARAVNATRAAGGRVIAVGTTVTRALETVAKPDGTVAAAAGLTDLVLSWLRPASVVDGLITGWHAPQASHLSLLEAVAGRDIVQRAYDAAVGAGYLWHEFGDSCLLLPEDGRGTGSRPAAGHLYGINS